MEGFKKKGLGHFRLLAGLLIILILTPQSFAAAVGHGAPAISEGMFESRRRAYHPIGYRQSDAK